MCVGGGGGSLSREKGEKKRRAGEWVGGGREGTETERDGRKGMECVG